MLVFLTLCDWISYKKYCGVPRNLISNDRKLIILKKIQDYQIKFNYRVFHNRVSETKKERFFVVFNLKKTYRLSKMIG